MAGTKSESQILERAGSKHAPPFSRLTSQGEFQLGCRLGRLPENLLNLLSRVSHEQKENNLKGDVKTLVF